jgi:hypothetical protein
MNNLADKIETAAAYIARCKCGCTGIIMATVDIPGREKSTAEDVAESIRDGYPVERTTVVYVREFTGEHGLGCLKEKAAKIADALASQISPGVYRITNFVTKEDVPYPRVANSNTRKPSEKWIEGWNDCMEGHAKKSTFGMSTEEHNDYLEGYEAAERD